MVHGKSMVVHLMKLKLIAMWRIMWNEHYLVMTPNGMISCYPSKLSKNTELIKSISEAVEKEKQKEKE